MKSGETSSALPRHGSTKVTTAMQHNADLYSSITGSDAMQGQLTQPTSTTRTNNSALSKYNATGLKTQDATTPEQRKTLTTQVKLFANKLKIMEG